MRVSLLAGDPLVSNRVVKDSRVLIGGQEFPVDLVALYIRGILMWFSACIGYLAIEPH